MRFLAMLISLTLFGTATAVAKDPSPPWITTKQRLTILSANDGRSHLRLNSEMKRDAENVTRDSITVVHLGPDHPPIVKTVFGTVPNTISGSPYMAMTGDGHYGFVTNWARGADDHPDNVISVIDLSSPQLTVVQKIGILRPRMAVMHPDGKRLIVPYAKGIRVLEMRDSKLVSVQDNPANIGGSIDISPRGDRVVATGESAQGGRTLHVFRYDNGVLKHLAETKSRPGLPAISRPFSQRFTPDGNRVLLPNGGGSGTKGTLDDLLLVDMTKTPPTVTDVISQVADGMESLAVHPQGKLAVVACLEENRIKAHLAYSHLAVIDLASKPARLLYHLNIEPVPEGIEFSPDGSKLFVGVTAANHIVVFDVEGYFLRRSPFVIRVGHAPSSMAVGRRFTKKP